MILGHEEWRRPQPATGQPDRPIELMSEDALGREGFVGRLASALISRTTGKATGVVIGITGPWGSGKSSILNLLQERVPAGACGCVGGAVRPLDGVGAQRSDCGVFQRAAWRDRGDAEASERLGTVPATIGEDARRVVPGFEGRTAPGAGGAGRPESLTALRARLFREMNEVGVPIVVLVDEIDRVEDDEIRAVAQLVRAVADFPSVSYVLAYDPQRVTQALGAGAAEERERGRDYLEKIVQLQIPLPLHVQP